METRKDIEKLIKAMMLKKQVGEESAGAADTDEEGVGAAVTVTDEQTAWELVKGALKTVHELLTDAVAELENTTAEIGRLRLSADQKENISRHLKEVLDQIRPIANKLGGFL